MRWILPIALCVGCAMPVEEKTALSGLNTNIAETQAPQGTLLEAENVVMRRPGCIEPRDGLQLAGTLASGFAAYGFSWRSKDFILVNNGSHTFDWRDTAGATYKYNFALLGNIDPQPFRRDVFSHAEARASLYVPYDSGTVKMDTDSGPWEQAGVGVQVMIGTVIASVMTGTLWLPTGEQAAYRVVAVRKDANGMLVSSAPCGYAIAQNTSGAARGVFLQVSTLQTKLYDYLEVYRSANVPNSVAVPDEMQLVGVLYPGPSVALVDFTDNVPVDGRGRALYTSPSRGGFDEVNGMPPAAAVMALFRGSMFWGNVRGPRYIKYSLSPSSVPLTGTATGIGTRTYTGDTTIGVPTVTNISSTVGLQKGMTEFSGRFPSTAHITNISGTTVTMSENATAAGVGTNIRFEDSVRVNGQWLAAAFVDLGAVSRLTATHQYQVYAITPPERGYTRTFVLETISRGTAAQTILATHGDEYNPPLPLYDATPLAWDQDAWPGGYIFSKTDEPEHVRHIDFGFIGDQNKAILAFGATRDALYVLKEDGLFRLTGARGVWRVDPVDPTAICVLPSSARSMRGRVVFLGDRGLATVDDEGTVELASNAINDQLKLLIDQIVANWASSGLYELPGMAGCNASCVFARESEYTLARGTSGTPFVYNDVTGAWTTLAYYGHANESLAYKALFSFDRTGSCVLSMGTSYFRTLLSTDAGALPLRYDRSTSVTVNSYAAGVATLSASVNALEDDVIKDSAGRYWRITTIVNNSASVPVQLQGGSAAMATGAGTLYRSLRCSVIATGFALPLASQKRRGPVSTSWSKIVGPVRLRYGYQSSQDPDWVEEDADTTLVKTGGVGDGFLDHELGNGIPARVFPTSSARAWLARVRIRWAQVHGDAQLEGIHSEVQPMPPGAPQQVVP